MICLENSHSRVTGNSSSTLTSANVLRMDTGVSIELANPIIESTNQQPTNLIYPCPSHSSFTFDREPCGGAHPFGREDNRARVLQGEVGEGEAVH